MASKRAPERLRRSESFLGIHFDFHAGRDCTRVGEHVTRRMVDRIIDLVRPDFVQCDCKGHPGLSSYPTKAGHAAPGFVRDPLRIWRDATAARGVALYLHYSGVQDREAVRRHPGWARVDEKGKRDPANTSVFGPYVDELLIPQLKELCDVYGVDGVWVDGECWSTMPDYGRGVLEAFRRETGIRAVPRKPTDAHWFEFAEFCREGFRRYLRHYVDAMHRHNRDFQIASNWAFTTFMPEPVSADVDFISGDYTPVDSVNSARLEAAFIASQGKPWDLMAWGFSGQHGQGTRSTKSAQQLKQEAAVVLARGGGFQCYFTQKRDGSIRPWQMEVMAEVARFCRARQAVCHRAQAVPQVGLLLSTAAYYRLPTTDLLRPWSGQLTGTAGVLRCLLDSQHSVELVAEHHLAGDRLGAYPLIVVPEWAYLEPAFRRRLLAYVKAGGNLLLVGPRAAAMFARPLGIRFTGPAEVRDRYLAHGAALAGSTSLTRPVRLKRGTRAFGSLHTDNDRNAPAEPAAAIARYGKGRIAATTFDLGEPYVTDATAVARDFLGALVRELFADPIAEVAGSHQVDVTVNRIGGKLAVNLVNTSGPHANGKVAQFDEIPAVGPLEVTIRTGRRPRRITLEPGGKRLVNTFGGGRVKVVVPRLEIHRVVLVA